MFAPSETSEAGSLDWVEPQAELLLTVKETETSCHDLLGVSIFVKFKCFLL